MAELRKAWNITQVRLTETFNISRHTINPHEMGARRVRVFPSAILTTTFAVSMEEPVGSPQHVAKNRDPALELQQAAERIQQLTKTHQPLVMQVVDSLLAQRSR